MDCTRPPQGVSDTIWMEAVNTRYWSSFHIAPLPCGLLAVFTPDWECAHIGDADSLVEWFRSPPPIKWPQAKPPPKADDELLADILAQLDI